jgi:hypothetical protein
MADDLIITIGLRDMPLLMKTATEYDSAVERGVMDANEAEDNLLALIDGMIYVE